MIMKYDFDKLVNRRNTNSAKWDSQAKNYHNDSLMHLGVADMDFVSPEPIQTALRGVSDHGVYGYTDVDDAFYTSIQEHYLAKYGIKIPRDWIVYSPRVINSAAAFINTMTREGDGVIINEPCYSPLKDAIVTNDRRAIPVPTKFDAGAWHMDFEAIEEAAAQPLNRAMFFVNPDNPTGTVWDEAAVQQLMNIAAKNKILLFTDEIHADLLKAGIKHHSLIEFADQYDQIVVANSLTKSYNIPGLEISYLIVPNEQIRETIQTEFYRMGIHNPNIFSLTAFSAGYRECGDWQKAVNAYIDDSETLVRDFLAKNCPGFVVYPRQGTYTLWISYRDLDVTAEKVQNWFLNEVGAEIYMGNAFGKYGDGFIRLNIATSQILLKEFLAGMQEHYSDLIN